MKILFFTFLAFFTLNTFSDFSEYAVLSKMRCEVIYEKLPKIRDREMRGAAAKQYREKFKTSGDLIILSSETNKIPLIAVLDFPTNTIPQIFEQGCEIKNSELFCEDYITNDRGELSTYLRFNFKTNLINAGQNSSSSSSRFSLESRIEGVCR